MYISKAHKQDLPAIKALLEPTGKFLFEDQAINKRDLAYQVRLESGELIGFIWCGIMAGGKVGYIDHFCVKPEHAKSGVGKGLIEQILLEAKARKIKHLISNTANDGDQIKTIVGLSKVAQKLGEVIKTWPGVIGAWTNKE